MEKKKDFIFVGNGRINPTETITNITIMLEKIPKELLLKKTYASGNTYTALHISIHRNLDKESRVPVLDKFGNSHFVVMDINKIDYEKEKASNPDPL